MNKRFSFCILLAGLVLQGCQTQSITEMNYPEQVKLAKVIEDKCLGYGLKANSPQFKQCFEQEVRAEELKRLRNRKAWQDFTQEKRQKRTCESSVFGSTVTTNCW